MVIGRPVVVDRLGSGFVMIGSVGLVRLVAVGTVSLGFGAATGTFNYEIIEDVIVVIVTNLFGAATGTFNSEIIEDVIVVIVTNLKVFRCGLSGRKSDVRQGEDGDDLRLVSVK